MMVVTIWQWLVHASDGLNRALLHYGPKEGFVGQRQAFKPKGTLGISLQTRSLDIDRRRDCNHFESVRSTAINEHSPVEGHAATKRRGKPQRSWRSRCPQPRDSVGARSTHRGGRNEVLSLSGGNTCCRMRGVSVGCVRRIQHPGRSCGTRASSGRTRWFGHSTGQLPSQSEWSPSGRGTLFRAACRTTGSARTDG